MNVPTVAELIPILQTAIGPVILISGVGLLLLTMTNRLGRAIDRSRLLVASLPQANEADRPKITGQLQVLWSRAKMIRTAIALTLFSALSAAVLIILLMITALLQVESAWLILIFFVLCMLSLIVAIVLFIVDINRSLTALNLELEADGVVHD